MMKFFVWDEFEYDGVEYWKNCLNFVWLEICLKDFYVRE